MQRFLLVCLLLPALARAVPGDPPSGDDAAIGRAMRAVLDTELARWYPLVLDSACGGFFSDVDEDWHLSGPQAKMIVTQARRVWTASRAAIFDTAHRALLGVARHGFAFLRDRMWDHDAGGFYDLVTREGDVIPEGGAVVKTAYGNAFAIYALAAYFRASGDSAAIRLAREAFRWLDAHSYDPAHGGYFQFLDRRGVPLRGGFGGTPPKDQNSSIHLLEALTELYGVWPDPVVRARLAMLLHLVRDRITTPGGYMNLFFREDWTPVLYGDSGVASRGEHYDIDHISFGHDVETAYLTLEASAALGAPHDSLTVAGAKKRVDFALDQGWDHDHGGLFDGGFMTGHGGRVEIVRTTKEWWAQVEALNTLLLMSRLFPADAARYRRLFSVQWTFCVKYLIDGERGGWYWDALDTSPGSRHGPKGTIWKADYHTARAMMNCIRMLRADPAGS